MLTRRAVILGCLAMFAACTEPEPALTGQFGGQLLNLIATSDHTDIIFPCTVARTGPLRFDDQGFARAEGRMIGSISAGGAPADPVRIEAKIVTAEELQAVITVGRNPPATYQLQRGVAADFSGIFCTTTAVGQESAGLHR